MEVVGVFIVSPSTTLGTGVFVLYKLEAVATIGVVVDLLRKLEVSAVVGAVVGLLSKTEVDSAVGAVVGGTVRLGTLYDDAYRVGIFHPIKKFC